MNFNEDLEEDIGHICVDSRPAFALPMNDAKKQQLVNNIIAGRRYARNGPRVTYWKVFNVPGLQHVNRLS